MDDSLLPRIDMARTTMRPAEAQVAAVILAKPCLLYTSDAADE